MDCTRCGKAMKNTRGEHHYTESGLANVVLLNVEIRMCPACGQREVIVPQLEELSKDGESGRQKINQYTRYLSVPMAFLQGYGMISLLKQSAGIWKEAESIGG